MAHPQYVQHRPNFARMPRRKQVPSGLQGSAGTPGAVTSRDDRGKTRVPDRAYFLSSALGGEECWWAVLHSAPPFDSEEQCGEEDLRRCEHWTSFTACMASLTLWPAVLVMMIACLGSVAQAAIVPPYRLSSLEGRRLGLVSNQFQLAYHNGPILTSSIPVYIIWYGGFTKAQKNIILDFIGSFSPSAAQAKLVKQPSVASWWSVTGDYKDHKNLGVSKTVTLGGQYDNNYSLGKQLTTKQIESIVTASLTKLGTNLNGVYLVLTAADVQVDGFCGSSCGSHSTVTTAKKTLVYAWVGNPGKQCAGMCAWPFASQVYPGAPTFSALLSPNGDVGCDGMVITIATVLAGCATSPRSNGYFQGEIGYPLEAATACQGLFGEGSFAGSPGILLKDKSHHSFNAYGINNREFLLPALWNPKTQLCRTFPN